MPQSNKVLFVASIEKHLAHFHTPYMQYLHEQGYEVHTAAHGENEIGLVTRHYELNFSRSPLGLSNVGAYRKLKRIIRENGYKLIHCHTPVASILTRLAAQKMRKKGTVIVYTVHGFHFFDGNSALKNILFRDIEKFVSKYTDCIITINNEDYQAIERYGFKPKLYFLTHGVGIDAKRFKPADMALKAERRALMGLSANDYVLIYPAEYSARKNQTELLRAIALLKGKKEDVIALLPGMGADWADLNNLAKELGITDNIRLLGMRSDVDILLTAADLSVAPARQEGLPTHIIEAMAAGLPCVASRIRGQVDLIEDGVNGFLYNLGKPEELAECIMRIKRDKELSNKMRKNSIEKVKNYFLNHTVNEMADIYSILLKQE